MPFANRLFTEKKLHGHHPVAEDALPPPAGGLASLAHVPPDGALFAVGGCFHVALRRAGELVEELSGREFQGDQAGCGDVGGDLVDDFRGQGGDGCRCYRCVGEGCASCGLWVNVVHLGEYHL